MVDYLRLEDGDDTSTGVPTKNLVTSRSLDAELDGVIVGDVVPTIPRGHLHAAGTGASRRFILSVLDINELVMLMQVPADVTYQVPDSRVLAPYRLDIRGVFFDPERDDYTIEAVAQPGAPLSIGIDANQEFLTITPTSANDSLNTITLSARQGGAIRASGSFAFNIAAYVERTIAAKATFTGSATSTRISIADGATQTFTVADYFDTTNGTPQIKSITPASGTSGLVWTNRGTSFTATNAAGGSANNFSITLEAELVEDRTKTASATIYVGYVAAPYIRQLAAYRRVSGSFGVGSQSDPYRLQEREDINLTTNRLVESSGRAVITSVTFPDGSVLLRTSLDKNYRSLSFSIPSAVRLNIEDVFAPPSDSTTPFALTVNLALSTDSSVTGTATVYFRERYTREA